MVKSDDMFEKLQLDILKLHLSKNETEYDKRLEDFKKFWKSSKACYKYIREQWINSRFNCWQIYHSPPGYANTNSNIESFNRQIKAFTQKKKLSVFGMVDKCKEMVYYFSKEQDRKFNVYPKYDDSLNKKAQNVDKSLYTKYGSNKAICLHSLGYSHLKDLNWFGPKFTTRSCEFAYNNKRGSKKGSKYKKATSALMMDAD